MFSEPSNDFIANSSVGIHTVSADGIITYANQCELEILGYHELEYVGHHVSEFQTDHICLDDMLRRLDQNEILKNYPVKVLGKNSLKYILYNTSAYTEGNKFVHTRCYGIDIEKSVFDLFREVSPYFKSS